MNEKALIIDISQIAYAELFVHKKQIFAMPDFLKHRIITRVLDLRRKLVNKSDGVIVAFDPKGSGTWRSKWFDREKVKFDDYKDGGYKKGREKSSEIDWNHFFDTLNEIYEFFRDCTDFKAIKLGIAEADDVVFVASKMTTEPIITPYEKDFEQIWDHTPYLKIWDARFDKWRKRSLYLEEHIIIGDASDAILPIKKISENRYAKIGTARKMIAEGLEKLLSLDKNLKERYEFNKKLIDFNEIPISIVNLIKEELEKDQSNFSTMKILDYTKNIKIHFENSNFKPLTTRVSEFKIKPNETLLDVV